MAEQYLVSKKYHEISLLAGETARQVSKNGEEWAKYLTTAARLYRYPFDDQMLIYAQRPDANACATMETWNEKMFCWVNRGAKGIALFDRESERPRLKYVFDVSDVHKSRRLGKDPYLWEIREEHKDAVLAQLEKTYGATDKDNSFESRLMEIAGRIAEDYYGELMQDMSYAKEGSFLEEFDDLNVGLRLRETLSASIAYTLLSRCGADMDLWKDELNFDYISEFNTTKALSVIGNATTDMCKPILMEIGKTVAAYDRHIARNKAKEKANGVQTDNIEKNPQKVLANTPEPRYNALKRESVLQTRTDIPIYVTGEQAVKNIETEGIAHGTDIREERGLSDTQPDTGQRAGGAADQVRADAQELSEGTPEGDLQRASADGRTESTLSGDTETGRGEDGLPDRADGESRGSGRSAESVRSDEMGGEDEQHQALGGGNRTDGAGLQPLNSGLQQNKEAVKPDNDRSSGEDSLSGSFLENLDFAEKAMELQKEVLCSDAFLIHKRPEIAGYFAMEQDTRMQTEYLKNSFRMEEFTELDIGEMRVGYRADEDGLTMWKGHYLTREAEARISWEDARFFVNSYIEDGVYLLPGEKAEQIDTNGMYQQLDLFSMFTEQVGSIAMKEAEAGIIPAEKTSPEPTKEVITKEQLDTILRSGGGRENSRKRIYAKYQQGKTPEEMAEFLKKEYKTTGKGFEFEGKQIAVWFDGQGMTAGDGTSAIENPKFTMSWQEIETQIRSQVENGTYMGANEAYLVDEVERGRIADHLYFFFRDGMGEAPEELEMKFANYPDSHARLVDILSTPEGVDMVASHMDKALAQLESGEKKLRFRSVMPKEELRAELDNLLLQKKTFPVSDHVEVKKEDFITQDEIDHRLGRGSGFEHGSFRIYDYFMEGHDSKEAAAFLKKEYGIGGSSHALAGADHSWEDHDSKGISLKKGDLSKPYADVLLPWKAVEKRIRKLIQEDKYLFPEGKEAYAEYKEEQAQKELEKAQAKIERDTKVACKDAVDRAIAENFDGYRLPKGTAEGVIKEYGIERVSYVLANTVMHRRQEERISPENKEWAKSIEPYAMYESRDIVAASHPAVLNGFINQARRYIEHEKELAAQAEAEQAQEPEQGENDISEGELDWHIVHDMDDDNGQPTEWSAKLPNGEFLWIDRETGGYALYDTHNTDADPVSVSETLDGAKESGEDYASELTAVDVEIVEKTTVALESSEDFSEPATGFYTHQYADGREGVRYRLVTTAEDGLLIPYPEHSRFFLNRELAQEYMDTHADLIDVIGYDEMVFSSMQKQSAYKREQNERETSGHDVQRLEDTIFIDGQECVKTDEWKSGEDVYVLGNSIEDSDFFYAEVNGNTRFEYDHKPDRAEIEDDFINIEAMRDIDRHEAEVFSRFEGGGEVSEFYYAISLTSDAFADSYCISVMDGSTGEEVQPYRDSHGDMPTFKTVDEAVDYCHKNGIDFQNAGEVDQWHTIEVERAKAVSDGKKQEDHAEKPLTADDIQNLVLTGREYFAGSRTTVYDFECDIRGEHDSLQYTLEYHDDGEGFTIHTEKDDIWERMSEPELERLEGILSKEAVYFKYHEKIAGTESLEDLKEIEYEIMEDESPDFRAVSERVWKDFSQKEREMSVPEQETSGHDVQKRDYRVGDRVYLDNKPYEITRTDDWNVEIMDRSLLNPPRRLESRENFEKLLRQDERNAHLFTPEEKEPDQMGYTAETVEVYPGEKNNLPYDVVVEKLHFEEPEKAEPEKTVQIDKSGAVNFHITDDTLGIGGAKEKFKRNIDAIRTLEKIEGENRIATPEEQKILSQYVGWGGLADAFDESKSAWAGEYQELKSLLSDAEYASARESTLNAHYTSPVIIRSIYEALEKMGFEKGNVLEPAMGIGNFFGMLPEKMQESRLYGVELDGITGRIAKQLYPKADIKISGFEKTDYPNDFFDVAVGNVPFGQYKVADRQYDKNNFLIHDYFFAKTLDKVRPGGVVAFVTSKGTMDKKSPEVRKYLAQRAELLGAVRLPNTAFKENAGTEVTSDIIFLKKRDRVMDLEPDWVHLSEDENGIAMNSYFAEHPEMIVGKMEMVSGPYGMESTCQPDTTRPFAEQLSEAISRIDGEIEEVELDELDSEAADQTIPADPDVKNYSYTLVDDKVYYRENSIMKPVDMKDTMLERIKGMVGIRDCTQELIRVQLEEYPDAVILEKQAELNKLYDDFSKKYGLINSQTNKRAFNQDSSYCLLCSLEKTDEEGKFVGKADMFTKRTIKKAEVVTSVDTATEALAVSLSEKAKVDLDYMAELSGKDADTIKEELTGVIFQNPITDKWETADEYLSGNVRDKLETAKTYAENHPEYTVNVQALTQVQPKELDASEIEVRIGATWVKPEYLEDFMHDTFETPQHLFDKNVMGIQFSDVTGQWNVKGKNADFGNSLVNMTYGTSRRNAYQILEDSLNLKDSRVYDTITEDGKEKRVLNKKETTLAAQKQDTIREAFRDWIFRDPDRRQDLVAKYNKLFNSTRPREYDGAHLKFPGMTPDIELKPHQKNAVAHVLYGDNTLLAHCVGAGKTFEMTAAAMESKRLGLCQKSLFVVPNHLTEQWASDFLRLYPGANILAATKKDFEPANRKKFCSRIATGDYDAVIIGHSQFEKIPLSIERQEAMIERQISEIELAIEQAKADNGERYTIKQMEKTRKSLSARLEKLNDTSRKDNVVTFEQLGVDRLFVDESHFYKNLFLYTKMRNVAGIAQTEAQKSSDMFAKCQYLDDVICCEL
jgi:N12 class adenine-specific DNA methylase/adenine-specific DNA methylase